ncbi:hypothetical protein GCM10009763_13930 [Dermacoccus profundi]|uniref:Uncharacterized protein n=1 Tax=Dermacoccus profundi TaxID=322602 RepID=A0ABN2CZR2_9MICO
MFAAHLDRRCQVHESTVGLAAPRESRFTFGRLGDVVEREVNRAGCRRQLAHGEGDGVRVVTKQVIGDVDVNVPLPAAKRGCEVTRTGTDVT